MSTDHVAFIRRIGAGPQGKVIVTTVLDAESVGLKDDENDVFVLATTCSTIYSGNNPAITLDNSHKQSSKEYAKIVSDLKDGEFIQDTIGLGIGGVLTGPYWVIKKSKSILEQMG